MDLSSQMVLFAEVVEGGSFSAAARSRDHSTSAVSRQIGLLENRLGVRLLNRSHHGISLTREGQVFFEKCVALAENVSEAEALVRSMSAHPNGILRVGSTVAFAKSQLMPLLPEFLDRYPEIKLSLEVSDREDELASEEFDVSLRFSEQIANPNVIVRRLAPNRRVLCASPAYVARNGAPRSLGDLSGHNSLALSTVASFNDWAVGANGARAPRLSGNFEASSADLLYHAALAGVGIARLSTYLVGDDIAAGRLVRLVPDYIDESSDIVAVYLDRRNLAPKVRVFIDFLVEAFGSVPPWERENGPAADLG
ncbi:LysR family transcriptional regulator [Acuticoccus sp. M5D2P5]|uniref:LysR family transcriptional regulator n=1 Tax=Acuticoccus kalidii TaxID=2910977 RepID=UPI001F1AADD1|nr:LysR family transcriptional regulator [Acuticoccus kalidii]MCF3933458.1 LysR family transcriptional regulator [Acuticoccus kalidii]